MATEYDPTFAGDDFQPAVDSEEAGIFTRMVLSALQDPNSLTLVKADWGEREVTCVVLIGRENEQGTDAEPVAVILTSELFEEIVPRGAYRPSLDETEAQARARDSERGFQV